MSFFTGLTDFWANEVEQRLFPPLSVFLHFP